jgi:hypothetical protein
MLLPSLQQPGHMCMTVLAWMTVPTRPSEIELVVEDELLSAL